MTPISKGEAASDEKVTDCSTRRTLKIAFAPAKSEIATATLTPSMTLYRKRKFDSRNLLPRRPDGLPIPHPVCPWRIACVLRENQYLSQLENRLTCNQFQRKLLNYEQARQCPRISIV